MQDAAPRLIPSLIEMLNTGYDEICEVQYNLLVTHKITNYIIVIVNYAWLPWCCESTILIVE